MNDFNLVDEPWIPCLAASGEFELLGLSELFARAHELRDLASAAPSERAALLRFLIALHQSALRGPQTRQELHALLDAGRFDDAADAYLARWRHRFGLFDRERPFMQPEVRSDIEATTVATLLPEWSSGNNATLADHHRDDRPPELTPAQAARALLVAHAYQLGGGVSKPFNRTAAPLAAGLVGLLSGETLFHTIVLNEPLYSPEYGRPIPGDPKADCPSWERETKREPDEAGTMPDGWLDLLTWCPRAIKILRDDDGLIRRCIIHQNLRLPPLDNVRDPHVPMRAIKNGRRTANVRVRPRRGVALWRQADVILGSLGGVDAEGVGTTFRALGAWLDDDCVCGIDVGGILGARGKVGDWPTVVLPVGSRLVTDDGVIRWMADALERAYDVAGLCVHFALGDTYAGGGPIYWGELDRSFVPLLRRALGGERLSVLDDAWNKALRSAARGAVDAAFSTHIASAREHERVAVAYRRINGSLARLLSTSNA